MRFSDKFNNFLENIKSLFRKYSYIASPVVATAIFFVLGKLNMISLDFNSDFKNNIVNISGVLSGFLFTAYGIFISLPDNKFIAAMKSSGYFNIIYKALLYGIVFLIGAMLFGLFGVLNKLMVFIFVIGISEVILSVYFFYSVTKYSSKSN